MGRFLVEGVHLAGAAIEASWPIECLLYSQELLTSDYGRRLIRQFRGHSEEVSGAVFESISGKENPQGILAVAQRRQRKLDTVTEFGHGAAIVSPQDPGNVGTILRTLEAVGGSSLFILDGGVDPFHATAVRAGMGASFLVPIIEVTYSKFDTWRRGLGIQLIGTSAHGFTDYRRIQPTRPWILLFGNEQKGLSAEQRQSCDTVVRLPMKGQATSLNLAVAAGILLFEYAATPSQ